jgi:hypothetical protein
VAGSVRALTDSLGIRQIISTQLGKVIALFLLPMRAVLAGLQRMRDILGLMIFLGVGVLIAAAVVWYVTLAIQWWNSSNGPPSIGTVTVLGLDEARAKAVAAALPAMVLAELTRIGGRTNKAKQQLRELEPPGTPLDQRLALVPIPGSLKTEVAIPQQIAGVDVGWLLSWIKDLLAPRNVIDLTVSYEEDGKKVSVFGHAKDRSGYAFFFQSNTASPAEVVRAAAASIIQHELRRGEIAVQPLPPTEYLPVVEALSTYATYEKIVRSRGNQPGQPSDYKAEYQAQLKAIGKIAEANTQWAELQWLSSEIAERAGDLKQALAFAINEQRLTPLDDPRYERLGIRLHRLTESNLASSSPPETLDTAREAAGKPLDAEYAAPIRKLLGVPDPLPPHAAVRLASILVPWPEATKSAKIKTLRGTAQQDEFLTDYATTTWQIKRIIAPDTTYEFVGVNGTLSSLTEAELLSALNEIAGSKPDILVFSFAITGQAILTVLRRLASDMIVVVAAGNEPGRSLFAGIEDVALVVGGATLNGKPSPFSSSSPKVVWAPGEGIPFTSPKTGKVERGNGTSYSAALVGGAAALLKAAHPGAKPQAVITAIRETAIAPSGGSVPLINISAATAKLGASTQAGR